MTAPSVAWGTAMLFRLPNGRHLWGREFELLLAGVTMCAGAVLHGLAGTEAIVTADNLAKIPADAVPGCWAIRDTTCEELEPYSEHVMASFQNRQMEDVRAADGA